MAQCITLRYQMTSQTDFSMPLGWALHYADLRKLNFKIFPYSIIYRFDQESNEIIVVAIQHQNRKPFYWKGRI
ncbi:MAG: type II toxin-antitoxin system RelE/ParE family toxin [Bacteroidetes bacterium]|nr:type II toxin-antitoxin system RelE/ParE family toxin [Bacteroidota bacterium]